VSHTGWTASGVWCQRSLNEQKNHDIVLAATYGCKNRTSKCHSLKFIEVNGKKKKEETTSEFTCYVSNWWCQYPNDVKHRYSDYITALADEKNTDSMMSPGLCEHLLYDSTTISGFADELEAALDRRCNLQQEAYYRFVKEEAHHTEMRPQGDMIASDYEQYRSYKWPRFADAPI
jgi:hypothetical protein